MLVDSIHGAHHFTGFAQPQQLIWALEKGVMLEQWLQVQAITAKESNIASEYRYHDFQTVGKNICNPFPAHPSKERKR